MKCGLCLIVKIENDEFAENVCLLKWAQFILMHINVDYDESLKVCQDCSKRLTEIHNFCEFVERNQLAEAIRLKETSTAAIESDNNCEINEIKLEYFSENEESIIEEPECDYNQITNGINEEEDTQRNAGTQKFIDSADVKSFIGKNAEGNTRCVYCNRIFKSVHALTCHIALKHYERKNICKICSKEFPYKRELYRHVVEKHKKTTAASTIPADSETCHICQESFENKRLLRSHLTSVHDEGHTCDTCGNSFLNDKSLELHIESAHKGNPETAIEELNDRTCIICNKFYKSISKLRYHVYQAHRHEKPYPCKACSLKFRFHYSLRRHFTEVHSQPDPNGCSLADRHCVVCNISFKTHKTLKNHMETIHKGERPFACGNCAMKFSLRASLRRHISDVCLNRRNADDKNVNKQKSEQENEASSIFSIQIESSTSSGNSNNNQEIILTESTDEMLFEDHIKNMTSSSKAHYDEQTQTNHGFEDGIKNEKNSEFDESESKLNSDLINRNGGNIIELFEENNLKYEYHSLQLANRKRKREIVDKDDLYCCICERRYESLSGLQGHMYTKHKDEQPYPCEKCGRKFRFLHKLRKHKCAACSDDSDDKLTNEDRLDRICSICQKYFSSIGSLREHMYTRHKHDRPHACGSCGMAFRFNDKLRKHLAEVHPKSAEDDADDRICILCNISYKSVHTLRQHMHTRHKSVKPFDCDYCGQSYNMKVSLKRHMQKCQFLKKKPISQVDDIKRRTCLTCNKVYKCVNTLSLHIYQCHYEETFYGDSND